MGPDLLYEKSGMILVVRVPKLGWAIHWLGTAGLQHLSWREPVHVTAEVQWHSGPGCDVGLRVQVRAGTGLGYLQF